MDNSLLARNRRLAILRFLAEVPGGSANTSILHHALDQIGHSVPRDTVEADAVWLDEQGLATLTHPDGLPVSVLRITGRGVDVSRGVAAHPGVDRPFPG